MWAARGGIRVSDLIDALDTNEYWRTIDGWPGYSVSSFGNVRGVRVADENLSPVLSHGYLTVTLCRGGERQNRQVHALVADAFLGERPFVGALAAHNDGNTLNCRVSNIRWATPTDNQADRRRHGTHLQGSAVSGAKLTERDIPVIRERIADKEVFGVIANDYGVSVSTISLIGKGRTWRHVSDATITKEAA